MAGNGIALLGIRVRGIRPIIRRIWFPSRKLDCSWHGISLSKRDPTDEQSYNVRFLYTDFKLIR